VKDKLEILDHLATLAAQEQQDLKDYKALRGLEDHLEL